MVADWLSPLDAVTDACLTMDLMLTLMNLLLLDEDSLQAAAAQRDFPWPLRRPRAVWRICREGSNPILLSFQVGASLHLTSSSLQPAHNKHSFTSPLSPSPPHPPHPPTPFLTLQIMCLATVPAPTGSSDILARIKPRILRLLTVPLLASQPLSLATVSRAAVAAALAQFAVLGAYELLVVQSGLTAAAPRLLGTHMLVALAGIVLAGLRYLWQLHVFRVCLNAPPWEGDARN